MPVWVSPNDITRHLKIDTSKPLTDEQWEAYYEASGEEIITESSVLPGTGEMGFWSQTLIVKYLRSYSLGPGRTRFGIAKNRYKRKSVREAEESIPFEVKLRRLYKLGNHEGEIRACINDEERRIEALPEAKQPAALAAVEAFIDKLEAEVERYWERRDREASR